MKTCAGPCGRTLPADAYGWSSSHAIRRPRRTCRDCTNAQKRQWRVANLDRERAKSRAWRAANREKVRATSRASWARNRETHIAAKYAEFPRQHGMSPDAYALLLAAQGGVCAAADCREKPKPERRLTTDHDHQCCPGRFSCGRCVRGLLCQACNMRAGLAGDHPEPARQRGYAGLAEYLADGGHPASPNYRRVRPLQVPDGGGLVTLAEGNAA
jgi:hypothetical protein